MKIQKVSQWFSLLLFVTMIAGCSSLTEGVATPSLVTPTLPVSSPSPTSTISSTFTPTATDIPTPLSTVTAVPTLPIEDARNRLLDLLGTNGSCQLPCLWGIRPGKSTDWEARNILIPLSGIAEFASFGPLHGILGGGITPQYIEDDLRMNSAVDYFYGEDDIVTSISFRVQQEKVVTDANGNWTSKTPIYDSPTFIKRVEYYSLAHLLSEQGIPTSVMIASSGPSKNRRGSILTHIAVFYPDRGIWAQYTTLVNEKEVGSSIISCPVNAHIEMALSPPGNPDSFFVLLDKTDWGITKNSYKPLDEATSMSIEEFYETFRNSTDQCIETPINIWPTPER
jgi:hypothetical protein